jgi:hypothetical protein
VFGLVSSRPDFFGVKLASFVDIQATQRKTLMPTNIHGSNFVTVCGEIMSYRSSLSTKKNGCCGNRVVIARVDDKIIEIEIVRFDISLN